MIYIYFIISLINIIAAIAISFSDGLLSDNLILAGIFLVLINLELINKKLK